MGMMAAGVLLALSSCDSHESRNTASDQGTKDSKSPSSAKASTRESSSKQAAPVAIAVRDWEQFREQLKTINTDDLESIYPQIRQSLKSDPLETLEAIDKLSPGSRRDLLLHDIFIEYPRDRHAELIAWADKSALTEDKLLLHLILNNSNSGLNPRQVLDLYVKAADPKTQRLLAKFSAQQSVAGGANSLSQCEATLSQLSPADQKIFAINFAQAAISKDLATGGAIIMADPDRFGSASLYILGNTAGTKDPFATRQAIAEFSQRTGDRVALKAFVSGWFSTDSVEVSKWAATLPEPLRNEAYLELASQLTRKGAIDEANKFQEGITDESVRKKAGTPE